jgi:hypothetical protein
MKLRLFLPLLLALSVVTHAADLAGEARKAQLAYAQKLDQLLAKAKTDGDTAAAKEIEGLIAQVEAKVPTTGGDVLKPLLGTWQHSEDSSVWKIDSTKEGTARGKYPFTLSYDAEKKRAVAVGGNWVNYLTFTGDPDLVNGSYEENGRTKRFKLTRVK